MSDSNDSPESFDTLLKNIPKALSQYSNTTFAESIYLPSSDRKAGLNNLIRFKFDNSYHHVLKEIDWHVFVTLKFRKRGFTSLSVPASKERKQFLWQLGHKVMSDLDFSKNDLQYFWSEEVNSEKQAHYHVLFHRVYSDKCSVEDLRSSIEKNIDPHIVQIPGAKNGQEPPHVQTIKSQDRLIRYVLKIPVFQKEPKVIGHSHKFVRFWNRHWNRTRKQVA